MFAKITNGYFQNKNAGDKTERKVRLAQKKYMIQKPHKILHKQTEHKFSQNHRKHYAHSHKSASVKEKKIVFFAQPDKRSVFV